jgi:hypothetical protein
LIAMNESETGSSTPTELTDQIAALRRQMITLLLALIVMSGTLTVYLWYQSRITEKEMDAVRPQAMQIVQVCKQKSVAMEKLVKQLIVYGQSHPDFQLILKKYGIPLTNSVPANPAAKR